MGGRLGTSALLTVIAVAVFLLAAFGVDVGDFDRLDLIAIGLACFAAGHVV
jgi:hypothetical protein